MLKHSGHARTSSRKALLLHWATTQQTFATKALKASQNSWTGADSLYGHQLATPLMNIGYAKLAPLTSLKHCTGPQFTSLRFCDCTTRLQSLQVSGPAQTQKKTAAAKFTHWVQLAKQTKGLVGLYGLLSIKEAREVPPFSGTAHQ